MAQPKATWASTMRLGLIILFLPIIGVCQDFEEIDSLLERRISRSQYQAALDLSKTGLKMARSSGDANREAAYHLQLAKVYYHLGDLKSSTMQFRLYAVLREEIVSIRRYKELLELEDAYLAEIDRLTLESELNSDLVKRLQEENAMLRSSMDWIFLAAKIGMVALIIIVGILIYDRRAKRKKKNDDSDSRSGELERLRAMVIKLQEETDRNQGVIEQFKGRTQRQAWYARHIQTSLLPRPEALLESIPQAFVLSFPKTNTHGDFIVSTHIEGKRIIVMSDCPGHGADAAYYTVMVNHHLHELITSGISTPSMVLTMMDQKIKQSLQATGLELTELHGSKMAVVELDEESKEVEFAGAGLSLIYVHLDELHVEKGQPFPVGDPVFSDTYYSSNHIRLSDGDMMYLTSDGFERQLGGKDPKKFMRSSLHSLFKSMYNQPLSEQKFVLEKVFKEWKGKNPQTDDVLVLGVKI